MAKYSLSIFVPTSNQGLPTLHRVNAVFAVCLNTSISGIASHTSRRHENNAKMTSPLPGHGGQNALLLLMNFSKSDILPPLAVGLRLSEPKGRIRKGIFFREQLRRNVFLSTLPSCGEWFAR
jgi:hypothetical protein